MGCQNDRNVGIYSTISFTNLPFWSQWLYMYVSKLDISEKNKYGAAYESNIILIQFNFFVPKFILYGD